MLRLICLCVCAFFVIITSFDVKAKELDIYAISSTSVKQGYGDRNQSLAVVKSLERMFPDEIGVSYEFDKSRIMDLKRRILRSSRVSVVISSGDHGIESLRYIKKTIPAYRKDTVTVWTGHHAFKDLENNFQYIDVAALPEYVITERIRGLAHKAGTILVATSSVPSSVDVFATLESYQNFAFKDEVPLDGKYLVVFYGGEAPDTQGNMHRITRDEVKNLSLYIKRISNDKDLKIVLINGPRTTKKEMEWLRSDLEGVNFVFLDFQDGVRAYNPILYLLKESPETRVLVTGDSSSMVDEVLQVHKKPIYVLEASSMSDAHYRHLEYEKFLGNISVLDASSALYLDNIPCLGDKLRGFNKPVSDLIAEAARRALEK